MGPPATDAEEDVEPLMTARSSARDIEYTQSELQTALNWQLAAKGLLIALALACVVATVQALRPSAENHQRPKGYSKSLESSMRAAVELQAASSFASAAGVEVDAAATSARKQHVCVSTANWTDGFSLCNVDGSAGPGLCTPDGNTCEAYAVHRWCNGRKPLQDFAAAEERNSPHLNCCACGGGSTSPSRETASGLAPQACSSYTACGSLSGDCCPNSQGEMLECCKSASVCTDTAEWANGWSKCIEEGYNESNGCTPGGLTCHGYELEGLCAHGAVASGKEWSLGSSTNYPEKHCCVCGGGNNVQVSAAARLL
eukprot:TRINITY_DN69215_c0_g1_i1.p1 TRINITY_DN69215_c0_g1~~TRINITY_DN69215_c0_g1_i1.p1  ORF type:complete len:348 (-),score=58.06 TRINITY_DN69215_c0_g1_i1:69-1010(-)